MPLKSQACTTLFFPHVNLPNMCYEIWVIQLDFMQPPHTFFFITGELNWRGAIPVSTKCFPANLRPYSFAKIYKYCVGELHKTFIIVDLHGQITLHLRLEMWKEYKFAKFFF